MKREGLVGKTSDPCCFPRSRCTEGGRQQEGKNRNWTLIVMDKGHAESSVSVAETWSGRAGTTLVDLGHASFCPLSYLSVCRHAAPWQRASVCFLKMIKYF